MFDTKVLGFYTGSISRHTRSSTGYLLVDKHGVHPSSSTTKGEEGMEIEVQTIRGRGHRGVRPRGCHGVDGVEDGGEEVRVGEARIRRRRWAARVPVPFGTVPALARNGGGGGERCGGASRRPRANLRSVGM